jgi:hypothetical protein
MNIYQRISNVMQDVDYLQKTMKVGEGKNSYKGVSDESVKTAIRKAMLKHGLVMLRIDVQEELISRQYEAYNDYKKCSETKIQHFSKVKTTHKIVNIDNPEEFVMVQSIGHGVDSQDKASGKALTYSSKYALLDTFLVPTGLDSDNHHSDDIETPVSKTKTTPPPPPPKVQEKSFKQKLWNLLLLECDGDEKRAMTNLAEYLPPKQDGTKATEEESEKAYNLAVYDINEAHKIEQKLKEGEKNV